MNHQAACIGPVHSLQKGDSHYKSVGERGEGEEGDSPFQAASGAGSSPDCQDHQDHDFLKGVGCDESEVHSIGIVSGDEVEGEERDCEEGDEAVDS